MTRTHGNTASGMQRAVEAVPDPHVRRAISRALAPENYDAESLHFPGPRGALTVREAWVREIVESVLREKGLI